jgi:hypothetical protein
MLLEFGDEFRFQAGDAIFICGGSEATQKYSEIYAQG